MNPLTPMTPAGSDNGSLALWAIGVLCLVALFLYRSLSAQITEARETARRQQSMCEAQNALLAAKVDSQSGAYHKLQNESRIALIDLQVQSTRSQRDLTKAINRLARHQGADETADLPTVDDDSDTYPSNKDHQHG